MDDLTLGKVIDHRLAIAHAKRLAVADRHFLAQDDDRQDAIP
ncbi:hypothetical protein [Sphingobium sp.]|nr:hypothetical protein [Sphingobium sp.]HUD90162.1 hypothetical protein [Sphingobium sp.]